MGSEHRFGIIAPHLPLLLLLPLHSLLEAEAPAILAKTTKAVVAGVAVTTLSM